MFRAPGKHDEIRNIGASKYVKWRKSSPKIPRCLVFIALRFPGVWANPCKIPLCPPPPKKSDRINVTPFIAILFQNLLNVTVNLPCRDRFHLQTNDLSVDRLTERLSTDVSDVVSKLFPRCLSSIEPKKSAKCKSYTMQFGSPAAAHPN